MKRFLTLSLLLLVLTSCKENEIEKLYIGEYYDENKLVLILNNDNTGEAFDSRHIKAGKFTWEVLKGRDGEVSDLKTLKTNDGRDFTLGSVISPGYPQNSLFKIVFDDDKGRFIHKEIADKR